MKKLLFVIPTLRIGGAEKALVSLLKSLDHNSVNVDLFVFEGGGILQKEVPEWVSVIEADEVTRAMTLEARLYLGKLFKSGHILAAFARLWTSLAGKLGCNVFSWKTVRKHIPAIRKHYDAAIGFLEGTTDFFIVDKVNADKKIGWIHTNLNRHHLLPQEIEYYNRFDNLVTISEECRKAAVNSIPGIENKICVIENMVLPEDIITKSKDEIELNWENCLQLVTVGRLEYDKGIDIGAEAAKILKEKGIDFRWHVLGYGSQEDSIREYINKNMLGDVFILHGMVSNPYPYMKKADIIVQPSRNEGKSIVLDEAKILGKAIVVTDYQSVSDQITNYETGIIVKTDPISIAKGIEQVFNNKELKLQLEKNCLGEHKNSKSNEKFYILIGVS